YILSLHDALPILEKSILVGFVANRAAQIADSSDLGRLLGLGDEGRKTESGSENDREPDQSHAAGESSRTPRRAPAQRRAEPGKKSETEGSENEFKSALAELSF